MLSRSVRSTKLSFSKENILINGDFDDGNVNQWTGSRAYISTYWGRNKLIGAGYIDSNFSCQYNNITLVIGATYKFSCWFMSDRSNNYNQCHRPVIKKTSDNTLLTTAYSYTYGGPDVPWTYYEEEFVATADNVYIYCLARKTVARWDTFFIGRVK